MGDFLGVQRVELVIRGFGRLLDEVGVAGSAAPSVRLRIGRAEGTAGSRADVLPVHLASACADPGLGVHAQPFAPQAVLLRRVAGFASFLLQLLADGADVVGFEAATAADVTYAHVVGAARVAVHVPARADARFEGEREFGQIDEALLAGVGGVIRQRLRHVVSFESGFLDAVDDELDGIERDEGVVVAIDADNVGAGAHHAGAALFRRDAVEIALGPDAETAGDRKRGFLADLDRPLGLLDVLEIFAEKEVAALFHERVHLLAELGLHGFFAFAAEVSWRLAKAAQHHRVALVGHLQEKGIFWKSSSQEYASFIAFTND